MRGLSRRISQLSRKAGCMSGEINECDRGPSSGNEGPRGRESLQWIVEAQGLFLDQFSEDICCKDLGERAQTQQGVRCWRLVRIGGGHSIRVKERLVVSHYHQNHPSGAGLREKVRAQVDDDL